MDGKLFYLSLALAFLIAYFGNWLLNILFLGLTIRFIIISEVDEGVGIVKGYENREADRIHEKQRVSCKSDEKRLEKS